MLCYSVKEADDRFKFGQSGLTFQRTNWKKVLLDNSFNEVRRTEAGKEFAAHINRGREIDPVKKISRRVTN